MEFLYIFLPFIVMVLILIPKNNSKRKLREIAKLLNFLEFKYNSLNSMTIYDFDCNELNIEIINKHINIEINSQEFTECTEIKVNLTLPLDISMNYLLEKINQEMNSYMKEYRKISPNKQISFIDYMRHNVKYKNISFYANDTIGLLRAIDQSIKKNNIRELYNIIKNSELALKKYNSLCQEIINIKADLRELILSIPEDTEFDDFYEETDFLDIEDIDELSSQDDDEDSITYKPIINVLEDIYKKAASLAEKKTDIAHILQQINDTSLYCAYQNILKL